MEVRSRRMFDYSKAELFGRLMFLKTAFKERSNQNKELLKYYPIALVACIEAFYRLAIKELIDSEKRFLESSERLISNFKFDFEIIKALHGRKITIGELISHKIRINNLNDIDSQMSILLDVKYLNKLSKIYDRWEVEINKKPKKPIIKNSNTVYKNVTKTFELRHIFCHESAVGHKYELVDIGKCFESTVLFLEASDEYISEILYPSSPLTQSAMNRISSEDYKREKDKLHTINQKFLSKLNLERQKEYKAINNTWEKFLKLSTNFVGEPHGKGTIRPLIENTFATEMIKRRVEEVQNMINSED